MRKGLIILLTLCLAASCQLVQRLREGTNELLRGEVVARVGKHKLYQSQLQSYIPAGVSAEDSAALATRFINAWAEDLLLLDMAQEQLSKADKDVKDELEEYRRTLLKYRYQQLYILQRLDTLITDEEIESYYNANKDRFRLDRPVIKSRYMIIPAKSRSLTSLKKKMSSADDLEVMEADSLGKYAALQYWPSPWPRSWERTGGVSWEASKNSLRSCRTKPETCTSPISWKWCRKASPPRRNMSPSASGTSF